MKNLTSEKYIYNHTNYNSNGCYWKIFKSKIPARYLNKKIYSFEDAIKIRNTMIYQNNSNSKHEK